MMNFVFFVALLMNSSVSALSAPAATIVGLRFSLYPNVGKENPPSLKAAVKDAVVGLGDLGVNIRPDDVSSCLVGAEPHVMEGLQSCFARSCLTSDKKARGVSMQGTLSFGLEDFGYLELPERTLESSSSNGREFSLPDAYLQPPRIAAQFAIYPTFMNDSDDHAATMKKILGPAKKSGCWKEGDRNLCFMLDGDGNEVFDVLRATFAAACAETKGVAMTITLTANKSAWPEEDRSVSIQ